MNFVRTPQQTDRADSATPAREMADSGGFLHGTPIATDDATMRGVQTVKRRVSFSDLQRMPEDGNRYELYDGELRVVPAPLPRHQIVSRRLFEVLLEHQRRHGGTVFYAPLDIVLSEYDVVQPDLLYFNVETARRVRPDEYVRFPPDLAIEILSPSTEAIDRGRKRDLYARYGVREFWIVDAKAHRIEVSVLTPDGYRRPRVIAGEGLASPTVAGLIIDLPPIFEGL
jgi:Uma2 family endonuclease